MATKKPSTKPKPKVCTPVQFEIPILRQPPLYVRGSVPPPPRVSLLPVHDSDAFIVDKLVLPRVQITDKNDPTQKRICYIIGWPDLPHVKVAIPCNRALEYLSPWTVEDWEYNDALRRDAEAEKKHANEARLAGSPVGAAASVAVSTEAVARKPGRKRGGRRRHPKAGFVDEPPPTPKLNKQEEQELEKRRAAGPSLSTPQKSRLAELLAEEETYDNAEEDEDQAEEGAVQRQLFDDDAAVDVDVSEQDEDVDMEESEGVDLLPSGIGSAFGTSSRATSTISAPRHDPTRSSSMPAARSSRAAGYSRASPLLRAAQQHQSRNPSVPVPFNSTLRGGHLEKPSSRTPVPVPAYAAPVRRSRPPEKDREPSPVIFTTKTPIPTSRTPVHIPPYASTGVGGPKPRPALSSASYPIPSIETENDVRLRSVAQLEASKGLTPAQDGGSAASRRNSFDLSDLPENSPADNIRETANPATTPTLPSGGKSRLDNRSHFKQGTPSAASRAPAHPMSNDHSSTLPTLRPTINWTAVAPDHAENLGIRPLNKRPADDSDSNSGIPVLSTKKQRKKKRAITEEPAYEVKRLEGDRIVGKVRYFKVRWEGNWPPGQNPTWEPEGNIDIAAVNDYLRKQQDRGINIASSAKVTKKAKKIAAPFAHKYASVTEAFEGKEEQVEMDQDGEDDDKRDSNDELRVVSSSKKAAMEQRKTSLDLQLA